MPITEHPIEALARATEITPHVVLLDWRSGEVWYGGRRVEVGYDGPEYISVDGNVCHSHEDAVEAMRLGLVGGVVDDETWEPNAREESVRVRIDDLRELLARADEPLRRRYAHALDER